MKISKQALSRSTRRLFQIWDQLSIRDGKLYRIFLNNQNDTTHLQLIVPQCKRDEVLKETHEGSMGGHLGEDKTLARIRERFYWPGYHDEVSSYCKTCVQCSQRKTPPLKARAPLQSIKVGSPMQLVAVDLLGPLPESNDGNSYILVVADYFTRWG